MEILRYVAEHHPVTVRDVADHVAETKGHVRTTVLNIMERLRKKGFLHRKKSGGIFIYAPTVSKTDLLRGLVRDFVDTTLGSSLSPFVAYLAEGNLSTTELAELKKTVRELEAEQKERR